MDGLMKEKIEAYFVRLGLPLETARELRHVSIRARAGVKGGSGSNTLLT